jgi:hypothetical protein
MEQIGDKSNLITLSFGLESDASLWNTIFEGFDQDVVLISRFEGKEKVAINLLYRFGEIITKNYPSCKVEHTESGLLIKKALPKNDPSVIRDWSELMTSIRGEMLSLINKYGA